MIRNTFLAVALACATAVPVAAQDAQTLADVRQQLSALYVDVQSLRAELSTTGGMTAGVAGATPLDRLNAIEAELQRLTSKSEELEFRIGQVVRDGTNRIGDLEFRLCELEEGCDIGALGDTPTLGGVDVAPVAPQPAPTTTLEPQLAIGEQADFEAAQTMMEEGDFAGAAIAFDNFTAAYPGSPLSQQAHYLRGESFESLGEMTNAARAYLSAFSADQTGEAAADALFKLGFSLGAIGQTQDACITLQQVGNKFPNSDAALDAQSAMRNFECS